MTERHELEYKWRVSENYWLKERGITEEQYKQVILSCPCDNAGFCESCMGNTQCEIRVLGFEGWLKSGRKAENE